MSKSNIDLSMLSSIKDDRYISLKDCLKDIDLDKYEIPICLGRDSNKNIVFKDLVDIKSILMSGMTHSGKSVFINSFINTILLTKTEKEVKLLFIDPKMVEMSIYENIPHNIFPIVHDTKKATETFTWCIEEIERRKTRKEDKHYIIIVADEYEDTMLAEIGVEEKLCKIASEGKEVGIFMILSSARASATIITKKLKNVIKTRIAFAMISKIDSKTLLDEEGGEELLGNGDMIFKSENEKIRVQAPWISYEEQISVVNKVGYNPQYAELEIKETVRDELLYERVKQLQKKHKNLTTNILQRELQIGYNKASEILKEINKNEDIPEYR